MNKQKLIGTIIGVIFFVALIAGATFAWLTFNATVTNGTYNGTTQNFVINYTKGKNIDSVPPILSSGTASTAKSLVVSAYRSSTTATGTLNIKLTTTSDSALTKSGALNYAVCSGTDSAANCTNLTNGSTGVLGVGTVSAKGEKTIYTTANIPTTQTYYWIFFWLDASKVTNDTIGSTNGVYSGYIHASATQS